MLSTSDLFIAESSGISIPHLPRKWSLASLVFTAGKLSLK